MTREGVRLNDDWPFVFEATTTAYERHEEKPSQDQKREKREMRDYAITTAIRNASATHRARAYRLILAALDDTDAGPDAVGRTAAEVDDCQSCRDSLTVELAYFAADRIRRSPTPDRWERWLTDRIAHLLDAAQEADA